MFFLQTNSHKCFNTCTARNATNTWCPTIEPIIDYCKTIIIKYNGQSRLSRWLFSHTIHTPLHHLVIVSILPPLKSSFSFNLPFFFFPFRIRTGQRNAISCLLVGSYGQTGENALNKRHDSSLSFSVEKSELQWSR